MPVDPALPAAEIARRVAEARLAVAAPSDCEPLQAAGLRVLSLVELLRPVPSLPRRPVAPDQAAVLLDGAVMTYRKLAALAARLASLFALRTGERVLSMRPLHDVCELAGGLLAPLFAGAQVSYGVEPDGFGGRVLLPEAEIPEQVALALRDGIS